MMAPSVLVLPLLMSVAYFGGHVHGIVGGHNTTIEKFPFQVSVQVDGNHRCGGSILSEDWILTSANCVKKAAASGNLTVRAGSSFIDKEGELHAVAEYVLHENFTREQKVYLNNVAALKLEDKLVLSDAVVVVKLAEVGAEAAMGQQLTVTGWGKVDEDTDYASVLQAVRIPALSRGLCALALSDESFSADMICAGVAGRDWCNHDGGAPLMQEAADGLVQVGIASFAVMADCGSPGHPSGFTNIAASGIRDWITKTTGL